ncbi:putative ATP-grasp-modified RiPP [Actinocatenispora rupis]|uniref:putative ATP-grasp-modified RiPP n=1 Tax=Actinocatenispora rupis TaxID=519421 RepID=UPI0019415519|nr:putative ATP-grasp-modified RiPP [Actinocatenispora rupis]
MFRPDWLFQKEGRCAHPGSPRSEYDVHVLTPTCDPLSTVTDEFPLGRPALPLGDNEMPTAARPFGVTLAVEPTTVEPIDVNALSYDTHRQVGMIRDGEELVPLARHTDGRTSTTTASRDGTPQDGDEDTRED